MHGYIAWIRIANSLKLVLGKLWKWGVRRRLGHFLVLGLRKEYRRVIDLYDLDLLHDFQAEGIRERGSDEEERLRPVVTRVSDALRHPV